MHRRHLIAGTFALFVASPCPSRAAEVKPYDPKAFAAAQEAGQGIVVFVHAPW